MTTPRPYPDFNGVCFKVANSPDVYFVDLGCKRYIPTVQTFDNLFRERLCIGEWDEYWKDALETRRQIDTRAYLAQVAGTPDIYLVDGREKRWIVSVKVFDYCCFSRDRIVVVPAGKLQNLDKGPDIDYYQDPINVRPEPSEG